MGKKLSEMTLDELWQLFPIFLTEPNPAWETWYREEKEHLLKFLPEKAILSIHHIGSTAISGIWAKPIIDILLETNDDNLLKDEIKSAGYILMSENQNRLSFNKGYTENGFAERVFHLHVRKKGDNAELYFRDFLNAHPDKAKEYEKLKLSLWKKYEHDRDGYTDQKFAMVTKFTNLAKQEFPGRY
ncbi:MAG: GrpB family protein [Clostridia bacterium]|nr:GrpB family protein [Clostridia bacterium]